jgi:hypothetical protein
VQVDGVPLRGSVLCAVGEAAAFNPLRSPEEFGGGEDE